MIKELLFPGSQKELTSNLEDQYRRAIERVIIDLDQKGLLGKHSLGVIPQLQNTSEAGLLGMIRGNLFAIRGDIYGEQTSRPSLVFAWTTNTEESLMIISGIPTDKIIIKKSEQPQPTIDFRFNIPHFIQLDSRLPHFSPRETAISTVEYSHPNDYLKPDTIHVAVIEANEDVLKQFGALQFGQALQPSPED